MDMEPSLPDPSPAELQIGYARAAEALLTALDRARADTANPDPDFTEADLCDVYVRDHQPTVFANGRYWRQPFPRQPWVPVEEEQIAFELLEVIQTYQHTGVAPTRHRLRSTLELLRLKLSRQVAPGAWDDSTAYLPFLDLAHPLAGHINDAVDYEMLPYIATTFPYTYDYFAECPHWHSFLQSTVPHAANFIQEFAGYCLTPYTSFELSLWLCGAPTSGKSTLLHGLHTLLGNFAARLSLEDLAHRRLDPHAVAGKRLLIADEAPPNFAAIPALPHLVDGTPFHLARPHGLPLQVQTHAKLVLGFSGLPTVDSRHASLYRRAALLVFPPRPPGHDDIHLKHNIAQEGPGLFMWALRGWNRLMARGHFEPPATMLAAANRLLLAATGPRDFITQRCLRDPNARTQAIHLKFAYHAWCAAQEIPPLDVNQLAKHWRNLGFERHRIDGCSWWYGVQLIPEGQPTLTTSSPE